MLSKKKHFDCKNCKCASKVIFKNKVIFCTGLVKNPNPLCDNFRFCISKGTKRSVNDIMELELLSLIQGLSTILFNKKIKDVNKK